MEELDAAGGYPKARRWFAACFYCIAFAGGVAYFVYKGGGQSLHVSHLDWLHASDWPQHQIGWEFYRRDGWHFPLGRLTNFPDPIGSSIALQDSIPWMALLFKPWASLLPAQFQYIGLWLALCFGLQAIFGVKLAQLVTPRRGLQLLAAGLFVVAPPLLFRAYHDALSAHWLILAMLWLNLRPCPDEEAVRANLRGIALLLVIVSGVHAYLMAMLFPMAFAALARLWLFEHKLSGSAALRVAGVFTALTLLTLSSNGYFLGQSDLQAPLYGKCAADLVTFINPMGRGTLLPDIALPDQRYDGFGYQGAGVLLLGLCAALLPLFVSHRRPSLATWRALAPLIAVCLLLALFSLSSHVTFAGKTVVFIDPQVVGRYLGVFQGTGRFIWPWFYLCLAGAVLILLHALSRWPVAGYAALVFAVALQLYDQRNTLSPIVTAQDRIVVPASPDWDRAIGHYRKLVLFPPGLRNCFSAYPDAFTRNETVGFGFLAARLGTTLNSAMTSRADARERTYCDALDAALAAEHYEDDTIYVAHDSAPARLAHAACGRLDGYQVCVSTTRHDPFRSSLDGQL